MLTEGPRKMASNQLLPLTVLNGRSDYPRSGPGSARLAQVKERTENQLS